MNPVKFTRMQDGRTYYGFWTIVTPHFGKPYKTIIVKVTKLWIIGINNNISVTKYSRNDGLAAGSFSARRSSGTGLFKDHVALLNDFADSNGGVWNGGWKSA